MGRLTDTSRDSRNSNGVRIYCDEQTALKRLYEYEDLGTIEEFKNLKESSNNEFRQGINLLKHKERLEKELKVYKRALEIANNDWDNIWDDRMLEIDQHTLPNDDEKKKLSKRKLKEKAKEQIEQARKELKNEQI